MARKIVIGIHGIGNKPPAPLLRKWWLKSIQDGFRAAGRPGTPFDFELAYWADILHPVALDPSVKDRKHPLYIKRPYVPDPRKPGNWQPSIKRKSMLDKIEERLDKIFFEDHIFINYEKIADLIIRRLFKDLDIYYHREVTDSKGVMMPAREVIRDRLVSMNERHWKKKIMLIAHSGGGIVAFDVLASYLPDVEIDTFITMGTPLGLPVIIKRTADGAGYEAADGYHIRTPENITGSWYNFSDLKDKVAMNYNLADDYGKNSHGVGPFDIIVDNTYEYNLHKHPHKCYGYLRAPEVSEFLYDFITSGGKNQMAGLFDSIVGFIDKISGRG